MHHTREVVLLELPRRQIDGHFVGPWPGCRLATGSPKHPFADRNDETAFLGDGDEFARLDKTMLGMVPTNQRLKSQDLG